MRILKLFFLSFVIASNLFATEVIPDLSEKSTPTLNEELRKVNKAVATTTETVDSMNVLTTLGDTLSHDGTSNIRIAGNTTTTKKYYTQTGTGSASAAPVWEALSAKKVHFGVITREASGSTESVAYTGVGFQPDGIIFFMRFASSATPYSIGADDATNRFSVRQTSAPGTSTDSTYSIYYDNTGGSYQRGNISAFGADGFTISWEKGSSPSGTMTIFYLATLNS